MMNKSVQLAMSMAAGLGVQITNNVSAVKQFFVPQPMSEFQGSMNTGSTKMPRNHIGKKGKIWSFVSSNHDGTGQFQCRQNGEIRTLKMKFKEPLDHKANLHFFGNEAA